ncbi:ribosome recycling factor family protein [Shewanella sp. UCD-KL12]|uniref:ribosome recycling factor family protein n=1 Tax=Shewanella sp. UCD-KL12 TaxID=1917163 RepID=UPI0009712C07|nr:ribosome recycling factor family protein [Shewanella sp. UCD-KL12]
MNEKITISLPSLIHRIGREEVNQAKAIALQYQCELKRVRRSRNWGLTGEAINIQSFAASLRTKDAAGSELKTERVKNITGFSYLIKKIATALLGHADKLEPLEVKLVRLIAETPNITLAELVHITDCTLAQARTARSQDDAW